MAPEDFLTIWEDWYDWEDENDNGLTLPLPPLWRVKVAYIPATSDEWYQAVDAAMSAMGEMYLDPHAVFDYAVRVVWGLVADRAAFDTSALGPYRPERLEVAAEYRKQREEYEARQDKKFAAAKDRTDLVRIPPTNPDKPNRKAIHIAGGCRNGSRSPKAVAYQMTDLDTVFNLCHQCFRSDGTTAA